MGISKTIKTKLSSCLLTHTTSSPHCSLSSPAATSFHFLGPEALALLSTPLSHTQLPICQHSLAALPSESLQNPPTSLYRCFCHHGPGCIIVSLDWKLAWTRAVTSALTPQGLSPHGSQVKVQGLPWPVICMICPFASLPTSAPPLLFTHSATGTGPSSQFLHYPWHRHTSGPLHWLSVPP